MKMNLVHETNFIGSFVCEKKNSLEISSLQDLQRKQKCDEVERRKKNVYYEKTWNSKKKVMWFPLSGSIDLFNFRKKDHESNIFVSREKYHKFDEMKWPK